MGSNEQKIVRHCAAMLVMLGLTTMAAKAQEGEYKLELGGGAGAVNYLGDYNGNLLKNFQPAANIIAKWNFNPRMSMSANMGYGKLKGSSKGLNTYYPDDVTTPYDFNTNLYDFSLLFESSFWGYGMAGNYKNLKRTVPYILLGVDAFYAKPNHGSSGMGVAFTAGVGVKHKLAERLNIGADWTIHFTNSDVLDGVADPYGIMSSGLLKNTDSFGQLRVFITYSLLQVCSKCNQ